MHERFARVWAELIRALDDKEVSRDDYVEALEVMAPDLGFRLDAALEEVNED